MIFNYKVVISDQFSFLNSVFTFAIEMATKDWSELKSAVIAAPFPIVLTYEPLSLRISILPLWIFKMFMYFLVLFVLTIVGFQLSLFLQS